MTRTGSGGQRDEVRVLIVQENAQPRDVGANVHRVRALLGEWPKAEIAVFPELFVTGYQVDRLHELALTTDGAVVLAIRQACAEFRTAFVGGYVERDANGCLYDSMLIVDVDGEIAGNYRKTHLFGVESALFEPGQDLSCIDIGAARIGPMICFDIEIAEVARTLAGQNPDLLVGIAANMEPYHADHLIASRARALDNRTPLVYVNRVGSEAGFSFVGGSRVVDSGGHILADLGCQKCTAVVDVPLRRDVPACVDYLRHLRPELYSLDVSRC